MAGDAPRSWSRVGARISLTLKQNSVQTEFCSANIREDRVESSVESRDVARIGPSKTGRRAGSGSETGAGSRRRPLALLRAPLRFARAQLVRHAEPVHDEAVEIGLLFQHLRRRLAGAVSCLRVDTQED